MKTTFRQGVVSHQQGGFLQVSGNAINILATNRSVTVTVAHKNSNYSHSEDTPVNTAWIGPFTSTRYWLYWDFNPLTFKRTFGHTTLEPVAQAATPGNGNVPVVGVVWGDAGIGYFVVGGFYDLPLNKPFAIVNSTGNNGNYTVASSSYNVSSGETTIIANEAVASGANDGEITLDIDSNGFALYTEGRHWFNTTTNVHSVLNGNIWVPVLRVFAGMLLNGTVLYSASQMASQSIFTGTQIGNNSASYSGRVLFDGTSDPLRRDDGTFFTTEDQFFTNQSRVDAIRLESNVTRAQCIGGALASFGVVSWFGEGQIRSAEYDDVGTTVVGLVTEDLINNEVGAVIIQGTVTNPAWNWVTGATPTPVGSALWVKTGELVTIDPHISDPVSYPTPRVPVARVLSGDTVIFEQGLGGVGESGPAGSFAGIAPANTTDLGGVTLLTASSDPARAFVVSDTDSRLTNARIPLAHTHLASNITYQPGGGVLSNEVQSAITELGNSKVELSGSVMTGYLTLVATPTNALHATTKDYVDNRVNGSIWLDAIHGVNLISNIVSDPTTITPAPNHGDIYIVASGGTNDWSGWPQYSVAHWNAKDGSPVTGVWENWGVVSAIHADNSNVRFGVSMHSSTVPSGAHTGHENQIAVFDGTTGALLAHEVPVNNNAVWVESHSTSFKFDQFAYDGTTWTRFGGSSYNFSVDEQTIEIIDGVLRTAPPSGGGGSPFNPDYGVNAGFLSGITLSGLSDYYALVDHTHMIPYDMAFNLHGVLSPSRTIGGYAVTRALYVPTDATGSIAVCGYPATALPTTLLINKNPSPYGSPVQIATIDFAALSNVGTITWSAPVFFDPGDMVTIATDGSPSDIEEISVTIVSCVNAPTCTFPSLPPAPTVVVITDNPLYEDFDDTIVGLNGSVTITGTYTSILWEQLSYSEQGSPLSWQPDPGSGQIGHLNFLNESEIPDATIAEPLVKQAGGSGEHFYYYKTRITVTGPGGSTSEEVIIYFDSF